VKGGKENIQYVKERLESRERSCRFPMAKIQQLRLPAK
jgi:hypothetical protein